jgi:nucleotide-binding universal stress UspA family protein
MRARKHVLVATTDGSARSFGVLPHAARLAEAAHLEFRVLHILDDAFERAAFPGEVQVRVGRRTREVRSAISHELAAIGASARITIRVKSPSQRIWEAIVDEAVALGAVALAMDTRGQNLLRTAVIGSTSLRVLAASHMPVLMTSEATLPARGGNHTFKILACTDGTARSDAIGPAMTSMLLGSDVMISVLRFSEEHDEPMDHSAALRATQFARWFPPNVPVKQIRQLPRGVPLPGVAADVLAVADAEGADVVALATRGHKLRHRILSQSVGIAVLKESRLPVLLGGAI